MEDSRISRRAFLKKFAALSLLSASGIRCTPQPEYGAPPIVITEDPVIMVEYGAEPIVAPEYGVDPLDLVRPEQMTYLDKGGAETMLYGSASVPTGTRFIIYFSAPMEESSQDAVSLVDADGNAVDFEAAWLQDGTALEITPGVELQYATRYVLEVGGEARNFRGEPLQMTGAERAEYTTVES